MELLDKWQYLLMDLVLAIVLMILVRYFSSILSHVDPVEELTERDNVAFGISLGGSIIAVMLILSGAIASHKTEDLGADLLGIALYGIAGMTLIKIGLIIHDKIILSKLDKSNEIRFKNRSVALVDAAASIAIALIINSFLSWSMEVQVVSWAAVIGGSVMGLLMLLCVTRLREYYYYRQAKNDTLQQALVRDQFPSALRLASELIGVALLFSSVQLYVHYNPDKLVETFVFLLAFGMALISVFFILVALVKHIVLQGITYAVEVDRKNKMGVACVEVAVHIGIAFFLRAMLS